MRRLVAPVVVVVLAAAFLAGTARVALTSATGSPAPSPSPQASVAGITGPGASASPAILDAPSTRPSPSGSPGSGSPGTSPDPGVGQGSGSVHVADAALDAAARAWLKTTGSPGVSAAVIWPDGRVWVGAFGVADAATGAPVTTSSEFALASITKTFTAALVLQLVDEGKLGLDQLVAPLLPEARLDPKMTVRHLLDHTSGLPDMFRVAGIEPALNSDTHKVWTVDDALAFGWKDRVHPDTFWRYSNTGYVYLGQLVERVTGIPWATLVRQRLLDPLGLTHTYVQGAERPPGPVVRGHRVTGPPASTTKTPLGGNDPLTPFTSVVTAAGSAGAIASTAEDVARWAQALYTGQVYPKALVKAQIADVKRVDQFHPKTRYGLGVQYVKYDKVVTYGHSGSFVGFKNQMRWLPVQQISVVILTNQSRLEPQALERQLIKLALAGPPAAG